MTSATGVTYPRGFLASGVSAGLKASGAIDVALVVNEGPTASASGVLTRNRVPAAPVRWTRQVLLDGAVRAVVLNSGGANACTGVRGEADTAHTAEYVAKQIRPGANRRGCLFDRSDRGVPPDGQACWSELSCDQGIERRRGSRRSGSHHDD